MQASAIVICARGPFLPVRVIVFPIGLVRLADEFPLETLQIHLWRIVLQLTGNLRLLCLRTAATHGLTPLCNPWAGTGIRPTHLCLLRQFL